MKDKTADNDLAIFGLGVLVAAPFIMILMIGVQIAPGSFSSLKFSTSDFATLIAGFVGAAIGGAISWMLARRASAETLARDSAARLDDHKAKALGILLKVQQITNGFYTNQQYIRDALNTASQDGMDHIDMWSKVQQRVGNGLSPPKFDAVEFVPLMLAHKAELIDQCTLMALRYDVAEEAIKTYNERREKLQQLLLEHSELDHETGLAVTNLPKEKQSAFEIRAKEINGLIGAIYRMAQEDLVSSRKLGADLSAAFVEHFGDSVFARLESVAIDPSETESDV